MINGLSKPIKDFLRQDRQYLIPRYQRVYVWEEKQWKDLFDDLYNNFLKHEDDPGLGSHFIGSIVILEEKTERYSKAHVIDGQQRLTTFFILLLSIMRRANIDRNKPLFEGIRGYLKATSSIGEHYDKFINEDNPYFKKLLENCATYTDQIDLIKENQDIVQKKYEFQEKFINRCFQFMYAQLSEKTNKNGLDINRFTSRIMETIVIETMSTNISESYTIFEILNARGKQLENHELIKNYIMRYYEPTDEGDVALKDWKLLMDLLKNNTVTPRSFFDHYVSHRFSRQDEKKSAKAPTAYDYVVRNCNQESKLLLDDLLKKAKLYILFSKPSNFPADLNDNYRRIGDGLAFFKGRSKTQFRPLFLSLFSRLYDPTLNADTISEQDGFELADIVYYLERFFFIYGVVLKCQNKPLERIVHEYAYNIQKCAQEDLLSVIDDLKISLASVLPDYVTFENAFCNLGYSRRNIRYSEENGNKKDIQYILALYEKYLRHDTKFNLPFSIEHIHKDTGADVYCKIGNLICLEEDDNSKLGSKSASAKMPTYRNSAFEMAKKVAKEYKDKWEQSQIDARGKEIAKVLYEEVWREKKDPIAL